MIKGRHRSNLEKVSSETSTLTLTRLYLIQKPFLIEKQFLSSNQASL